MATARVNAACRLQTSRRLDCNSYVGLRAKMVRISYVRTVAVPRRYLSQRANEDRSSVVITASASGEMQEKRYPGESEGLVEEMRLKAIRLHTKDQAKEGQRVSNAPEDGPVAKWEFTVERCLRFLVDNKLLYDTLERIIDESTVPTYAVFKNTGLERTENLRRDLEWFKEQGYEIPEPMTPGKTYAEYLEDIAEKDHQAFICHFYNIYFAQSAGGRLIGKKLSEKILDNKELDFYKWDGQISQLLQNVKENLNKIAEVWTREEKNHCLEETEKSFKCSRAILRLLLS